MGAPAAARRSVQGQLALLVVSGVIWVAAIAACKCEAYAQNLRHPNFGKYHASHYPAASTPNYPVPSRHHPPSLPSKPAASSPPHLTLAVEGVVVCQNCRLANTDSLLNSIPLKGAKVKLACRDIRFKTFVYETTITNEQGYFLFQVENFQFRRHKGVRGCKVALVSSSNPSCAKLTNVNAGKIGSPLTTRVKVYEEEILYSVGPFAFSPSPSSCYKH